MQILNTEIVTEIDFDSSIKKIAELVTVGINSWNQAGQILVALYDADPKNRERIAAAMPDVSEATLSVLERIGRRKLVPRVFASEGPGFRKLQTMPYDLQLKYLNEPVDLVVLDDSGKADVLKVAVRNLSSDQASQVFAKGEVRDLGAQRAYLANRRTRTRPQRVEDAYVIRKDRLIVSRPCELTRQQLTSALALMG